MCVQKQQKISGRCVWVIKAWACQLENLYISKDVHFIEVRHFMKIIIVLVPTNNIQIKLQINKIYRNLSLDPKF